jgi:hypothetical protein
MWTLSGSGVIMVRRYMARSRTFYPKLIQALPPGDPLAKLAARALVLYGDLLFEWPGIVSEEGFDGIDKLGKLHRRLYFFRASLVTLQSCNILLDQLMANPSFRAWVEDDAKSGAVFKAAKKGYTRHKQLVTRLRDELGAHAEQEIGEAITRFEPDDLGSVEVHSEDLLRPHLATQILINAILRDVPKAEESAEIQRMLESVHEATKHMLTALTHFLAMYGKKYPLFPG